MSSETKPSVSVVENLNDDTYKANTGVSREQMTRITAAVLTVIAASLPDGLQPRQQLTTAVNVIGMAAAELIASTGAPEDQREELIGSITDFVRKNSKFLAEALERQAEFNQFLTDTINKQGDSVLPDGQVAQ